MHTMQACGTSLSVSCVLSRESALVLALEFERPARLDSGLIVCGVVLSRQVLVVRKFISIQS